MIGCFLGRCRCFYSAPYTCTYMCVFVIVFHAICYFTRIVCINSCVFFFFFQGNRNCTYWKPWQQHERVKEITYRHIWCVWIHSWKFTKLTQDSVTNKKKNMFFLEVSTFTRVYCSSLSKFHYIFNLFVRYKLAHKNQLPIFGF